ncbi:type 2 periplasmic-binding domain-containing protein [Streptomyces malaysiensis]|uniref:hypothetical protein n=1 Tax=Streptomyces malaysiensis TaxID=92644 RepID=UPI002B2FADFC|nr:hypothetical protein R8789_04605 [Streptomyces malaysiensis]
MPSPRSALPALCAVSSALTLTVAVTGCGALSPSAGGGKGGTLVVAGYGGSFETAFRDSVLPAFELNDKVVLPSITNTYGMGLLVGAAKANGGSERDVDPGLTAVKKIAANAATFDTTADVSNYFLQGQAAASVWGGVADLDTGGEGLPDRVRLPEGRGDRPGDHGERGQEGTA